MNKAINFEIYSDILNTIGKWKIIDLKGLHKVLPVKCAYRTLRRKILELEKFDYVKSKTHVHNKKYLYLTGEGVKFANNPNRIVISDDIFSHDLLVSEIIIELLNHEYIMSGECYPVPETNNLEPDGIVIGSKNSKELKFAIELELTQKSSTRVKDKLSLYSNSYEYDLCVFISNNLRIIATYIRYLSELHRGDRAKFIFIYCDSLYPGKVNFAKSRTFYNEKEIQFEDLFGQNVEAINASHPVTAISRPSINPD